MYAKRITKVNASINIETAAMRNRRGGWMQRERSGRVFVRRATAPQPGCNNRPAVSRYSTHRTRPRTKLPVMSTSKGSALLHVQEGGLNATASVTSLRLYSISTCSLPQSIILSSPDSNYNTGINSGILARVLIAELALNVNEMTNGLVFTSRL